MHAAFEPLEQRARFTIVYSGPLVITKGGTYTGNWQSLDSNIPAVKIATSEPVTIVNSNVRAKADLIQTAVMHAKVTISSTNGYGVNPNVSGRVSGRFFDGEFCDNIVVKYCYLESTGGIYILNYAGNHTSTNTIKIVGNTAKNIDGRKSNGAGGWLDYNERTPKAGGATQVGYEDVQFLQLDQVHAVGGIEISFNRVTNEPGKSRVEDNISIYKSSGTRTSPILIHDNTINGAYTIKPWQASYSDATYTYDWSYSGGGIMLGDGKGSLAGYDPGCVKAYYNTVSNTSNYGIAIGAGHDEEISHNTLISNGKLADGRRIYAQNVGIYIWDHYKCGSTRFYNNTGHDNSVVWIRPPTRNDWWVPNATSFLNNILLQSF